jgi:hypothetical protein
LSDTGDRGNPFLSSNPFAEFLTTFLQVRSCMDSLGRRSAALGQRQMSLSDELAFKTARQISQASKALADQDLQGAVMQAVMGCASTCSVGWNSVGGVRMPQSVEMNFAHVSTAFSGRTQASNADGPSWDHAKGESDAAQEMENALRETVQRMVAQLDEASRGALTQFSQMAAVLTKTADEQASSLTHRG